jgi:hypothetical protein
METFGGASLLVAILQTYLLPMMEIIKLIAIRRPYWILPHRVVCGHFRQEFYVLTIPNFLFNGFDIYGIDFYCSDKY